MKVLVTGATGFVGAHSVAALLGAGHGVRLLVRDRQRLPPALQPLGIQAVDAVDAVVGDVIERETVERALDGCEAVVHAASVYSFDPRRRRDVERTSVAGAAVILGAAARSGLDPILHVSSFVALLPAQAGILSPDTPPGWARSPYLRSKAEQERVAQGLQEDDAPVVIVQPGFVWGPHDPLFGESHQFARNILARRLPIVPTGGVPIVDVRAAAAAIARAVERGHGPRRYLLGGTYVALRDLVRLLAELTGRRLPALPLPKGLILPVARLADLLQQVIPGRIPLPREGTWLTRQRCPTDDSRARNELGFTPRDLRETLADTVRSLVESGRISPRQAGSLAPERPAGSS